MNIVFITNSYHPNHSANSKCLYNVINILDVKNEVKVIAVGGDKEKKITHLNNHEIIWITTRYLTKRKTVTKKINTSQHFAQSLYKVLLYLIKVFHILKISFSRTSVDYDLVEQYYKILSDMNSKTDIIIPSCNPIESNIAALKYRSNNNENVKVVPFLFDKYSVSKTAHRFMFLGKIKMKRHLKIEEKILSESYVILTYFSWKDHIKEFFPEFEHKVLEISHPLLVEMPLCKTLRYSGTKEINIVYTGGLSKKIRNPKKALSYLKYLVLADKNIKVHLYIKGDCYRIVEDKIADVKENILNYGFVSSQKALSSIERASHLLLIGNNDITQLQSKVYEYMSFGKPIILLYKNINDPLINVLEKYPNKIIIDDNLSNIKRNNSLILDFIARSNGVKVPFSVVEEIYSKATPKYVSDIIDSYIIKSKFGEKL